MNSPYRKPHRSFISLARHRRSDAVLKLKAEIARDRALFGGRFTSELKWNESRKDRQWFDFYFVGEDRFTIWNAQISTARREFWCEVEDQAFSQACALIAPNNLARNHPLCSISARHSAAGKIETYNWVQSEGIRFQELGQMTLYEYAASVEADIATRSPPSIHESFLVDSSYAYGIGLSIVVDSENINRAVIESSIDRFIKCGCKNWQADLPVAATSLFPKQPY